MHKTRNQSKRCTKGGIDMLTKCDKCSEVFRPGFKTKSIAHETDKVFFVCPRCNHKYVAFVSNELVKRKQRKIKGLYNKIIQNKILGAEQDAILKQIEKEQKEVEKEMEKLKKKYA